MTAERDAWVCLEISLVRVCFETLVVWVYYQTLLVYQLSPIGQKGWNERNETKEKRLGYECRCCCALRANQHIATRCNTLQRSEHSATHWKKREERDERKEGRIGMDVLLCIAWTVCACITSMDKGHTCNTSRDMQHITGRVTHHRTCIYIHISPTYVPLTCRRAAGRPIMTDEYACQRVLP